MNNSSSSVDKTRIALIALAVILALGIGAVIYFITDNDTNRPQSHIGTNGRLKTTSNVESTTPSISSIDKKGSSNNSSLPKIYRDTENSLNDEAIEQHLQINEFALRDKCVIIIKNNTKQNLYMQFLVSFFDESGNEIDNDLDFTLSVASGDDMAFLSSCEREYDHAKYSLDVHPTDDPPAPLDLSIVDNSNEVLVIAENNGAFETQDPILVTLFFKGDQLVDAKKVVGSISAVDNWVATKLVVPIDSIDENTRREYYLHADPFILSPE